MATPTLSRTSNETSSVPEFTPESVQALTSRAIPVEHASELGIRPVVTPEDLPDSLRWAWDGPGMVINWNDGECTVPQYRPDTPARIHTDRETGKPEDGPRKYLFPRGAGSPLNWLRRPLDNDSPVLVVEGALKGPSVASWAPNGAGVVAIVGCWNWRGADLSWALGRDVYLMFDRDRSTNADVWTAAKGLADAVTEAQLPVNEAGLKAAIPSGTVRYVAVNGSGKDGVDDVLGRTEESLRTRVVSDMLDSAKESAGQRPYSKDELDRMLPGPENPTDVAKVVAPGYVRADIPTLMVRDDQWFQWDGPKWTELTGAQVDDLLRVRTAECVYHARGKEGLKYNADGTPVLVPWNPKNSSISELRSAMRTELNSSRTLGVQVSDNVWQSGRDHGRVMSFANGLLRFSDRKMVSHTPAFFNLSSVPYDYVADAPEPVEWLKFLNSVWPDDPDSVAALQEWFGYVLSGRTDLQKALAFLGPTRSGKGTITRTLARLIGEENTCGISMGSLASNFGMQQMIGKLSAVIGDARLDPRDRISVMERILTVTGEDAVQVDRKYRAPWNGTLSSRLTILSNNVPDFPDESGAIAARLVTIATKISFLGREDRGIEDRCKAELSGILCWALDGLDRLNCNGGRFTNPESAHEAQETYRRQAAPVSSFVSDWCVLGPKDEAAETKADLYDAYKAWCQSEGMDHPLTLPKFAAAVFATGSNIKATKPRVNGKQVPMFAGVSLTAVRVPGVGWQGPETAEEEQEMYPETVSEADSADMWAGTPMQETAEPSQPAGDPVQPLPDGAPLHPDAVLTVADLARLWGPAPQPGPSSVRTEVASNEQE